MSDARIPVTGCYKRFPLLDRHGKQIHVGDRIRYQYCSGRYGQTAIGECLVEQSHYPYGQIGHATFYLTPDRTAMEGRHVHEDFEHGHEKWVEIIESKA